MHVQKKDAYRAKDTGNLTFVYHVVGTTDEIADYKEAQTANGYYREDNNEFTDFKKTKKNPNMGLPLFYSPVPLKEGTELRITFSGRVVPDNLDQLETEALTMQSKIQDKRAEAIVEQQLSGTRRRSSFTATSTETPAPLSAEEQELLAQFRAKAGGPGSAPLNTGTGAPAGQTAGAGTTK